MLLRGNYLTLRGIEGSWVVTMHKVSSQLLPSLSLGYLEASYSCWISPSLARPWATRLHPLASNALVIIINLLRVRPFVEIRGSTVMRQISRTPPRRVRHLHPSRPSAHHCTFPRDAKVKFRRRKWDTNFPGPSGSDLVNLYICHWIYGSKKLGNLGVDLKGNPPAHSRRQRRRLGMAPASNIVQSMHARLIDAKVHRSRKRREHCRKSFVRSWTMQVRWGLCIFVGKAADEISIFSGY